MDLVLNNLQRLICHKTHQTKPKLCYVNIKYNYLRTNKIIEIDCFKLSSFVECYSSTESIIRNVLICCILTTPLYT